MKTCDLHTHSTFSDGTLTPRQLLQAAADAGLSAVALTDHNTVAGLPDFLAAAPDFPVRAICGTEFSVEYKGTELHVLALFLRPEHFDAITAITEDFHHRKEESNRLLVENLKNAGFDLDYAAIKAASGGYVNRAHIGAALTEKGYTETIKDAFRFYLSPRHGYYIPPARPDVFRIIRFIKKLGATAVLAHPLLNLDEDALREFLPQAVAAGLDGMETLYPNYDAEQTRVAKALAADFGLLESGGSDFHGGNKPLIRIGVGKDNLQVPESLVKSLQNRAFSE